MSAEEETRPLRELVPQDRTFPDNDHDHVEHEEHEEHDEQDEQETEKTVDEQTDHPMDHRVHEDLEQPAAPDRPRDLRPVSLVLGVLYLGVVAAWALAQSALLGVEDLGIVLPTMLLVAGLAGLVGMATRRRGTLTR